MRSETKRVGGGPLQPHLGTLVSGGPNFSQLCSYWSVTLKVQVSAIDFGVASQFWKVGKFANMTSIRNDCSFKYFI